MEPAAFAEEGWAPRGLGCVRGAAAGQLAAGLPLPAAEAQPVPASALCKVSVEGA